MNTCQRLIFSQIVRPCLALLACCFASCFSDPNPTAVYIDSPSHGSTIASLTSITGTWVGHPAEVSAVKLSISRYSDGKYWNGSSWGGSAILTTDFFSGGWSYSGPLPSGSDPDTGLLDGYYHITAIEVVLGEDMRTAHSIFAVGVTAPPVTSAPYVWGFNSFEGLLGAGPGLPWEVNEPTAVFTRGFLEGKQVVAVAVGSEHTLALTSEGKVYAWGDNDSGQLGTGNLSSSFEPVPVDMAGALAGKVVTAIAAGSSHSLAVTSDGLIYAWGSNSSGALGDNGVSGNESLVPVPVVMSGALVGKKVVSAAAGVSWSLVLTSDGQLFSWGYNNYGSLGIGNTSDSAVPVAVLGLGGEFISAMDAGRYHFIAMTSDGRVFACGENGSGQLGNGATSQANLPVQSGTTGIMVGKTIRAVAAGDSHSLALDAAGKVYAWGSSYHGELGTGTSVELSPVQILALAAQRATHIGAGEDYSFAATVDDKVFAWGSNQMGQLAGATALDVDVTTPTEADFTSALAGGKHVQQLSCGDRHAVVLISPDPLPTSEISVEAQGIELTDGAGPAIGFGARAQGTSTPIFVTVRNSGTSDLTDLSASIDGANDGDFFTTFNHAALEPNGTIGFHVFFNPTAEGARTATLHIASNDADESSFEITLTGTGYPPGVSETGFNAGLDGYVRTTVLQPDGKILLGGSFTTVQPTGTPAPVSRGRMARLNADGTLDALFHPNANSWVHVIAVQDDGRILIGGEFTSLQPGGTGTVYTRNWLARLNEDGTVDAGFNAAGALVNGLIRCIVPLPDGRILIGGQFTTVNDGSGPVTRNRIARLNADGTLDTGFNPNANGEVLTMVIDAENRIVLGGYFSGVGGVTRYGLARLDSSGELDDDFNYAVSGYAYALAVESDGSVLVGGDFTYLGSEQVTNLARIKPDDAIDTGFQPSPNRRVQGLGVQTDGSIIVSGAFDTLQPLGDPTPVTRNLIARLFANGSLDAYFDPNVTGNEVFGAAIQKDGQIVIGGSFSTVGTGGSQQTRIGIARLDGSTVTDNLTVPSLSYIHWERGGGAPETLDVHFDLSIDGGSTWTALTGTVSRSPTGWQQTGVALPSVGRVRARARTTSGNHNGSSGFVQSVVIFGEPPEIDVVSSGGIVHTNGSSRDYGVVNTGSGQASLVFTIANSGATPLTGLSGVTLVGDAASFIIAYPPMDTVGAGSSTAVTITFAPRTAGAKTATLQIPNNDPDENPFEIVLTGCGGEPITTWKQRYFGDTTNMGNGADVADPDGDGKSNLVEYATASSPTSSNFGDVLAMTPPGGGGFGPSGPELSDEVLEVTYTRNKLALGEVIFEIQWSETLGVNDWHTDDVTEEVLSDNGTVQQIKATIPAGSAGRRFVRLKLTRL